MNDLFNTLPENWGLELEKLILKHQKNLCRPREYLASPCKDDNPVVILRNMQAARLYLYYAYTKMGINAWAPQAYLPMLLCDATPCERAYAMGFGLGLVDFSKRLHLCGRMLTGGMKQETMRAAQLYMPILTYDRDLYLEVQKQLQRAGFDKKLVRLDDKHSVLSLSPSDVIDEMGVKYAS